MASPELKVVIICFITMTVVFIISRIMVYLDDVNRDIRRNRRALRDNRIDYGPSVAAAPSGNILIRPSVSISPPPLESPSPSASPSVSVSASEAAEDYYIDPIDTTNMYDPYASSSISYIPNPAVHHHRIDDELVVEVDRYGRQYIVGTVRKEEKETVFSTKPEERPTRKLDE